MEFKLYSTSKILINESELLFNNLYKKQKLNIKYELRESLNTEPIENNFFLDQYEKYITKNKPIINASVPRKLIITIGAPCSGKSAAIDNVIKQLNLTIEDFVHVDPDEARYFSLDYQKSIVTGYHDYMLRDPTNKLKIKKMSGINDDRTIALDFYGIVKGNDFIIKSDKGGVLRSYTIIRDLVQDTILPKLSDYNVIYNTACLDYDFCKNLFYKIYKLKPVEVYIINIFTNFSLLPARCLKRFSVTGRYITDAYIGTTLESIYGKESRDININPTIDKFPELNDEDIKRLLDKKLDYYKSNIPTRDSINKWTIIIFINNTKLIEYGRFERIKPLTGGSNYQIKYLKYKEKYLDFINK